MNWQSFKSLVSKKTKKEKEDAFELLVKVYLQNSPNYRNILKSVWLLSEVPSTIRNKLMLPADDQGIDILCLTVDNEYWAVQVKYNSDESKSQTRRSLATFSELAFVLCNNISRGIVCTTANKYSKLYEQAENINFLSGSTWRSWNQYFDILYKEKEN